jgi:hypothetical protein
MNTFAFSASRKIDHHAAAAPLISKRRFGMRIRQRSAALVGVLGLALAITSSCFGINASPDLVELQQPDGTPIKLYVRGDERLHWFEDERGFTVICDAGRYVYAGRDGSGRVVPTTFLAGKVDPSAAGIAKGLQLSPHTP